MISDNPMKRETSKEKISLFWKGRKREMQTGDNNVSKRPDVRQKISDNNPMRNEEFRTKQKLACNTEKEKHRRSEVMSNLHMWDDKTRLERRIETYSRNLSEGKYHNRNNWETGWFFKKDGTREWYDSSYERNKMKEYESEGIMWTKKHGIRIPYVNSSGLKTYYVPDFLIIRNEVKIIEEVKGWMSEEVVTKAKVAIDFCKKNGYYYRILLGKELKTVTELSFEGKELMNENHKSPEKEVEKFFLNFLRYTEFSHHTFSVGGYVRDSILKNLPKDLDIVIDIKGGPEKLTKQLHALFSKETTNPINMGNYPIWQITFKEDIIFEGETYRTKGAVIEFAETMKESYPDPNSRQRSTEFADLGEDVKRRDFTTNMMMKDLSNGEFIDLTGVSKSDIQKGILRGHPDVDFNKILNQDALRMIRLVRFICKYNWTVPLSVLKAVKANSSRIQTISEERIRDELIKIMKLGKLQKAIKFFDSTGLLKYIFPEIESLKGVKQNEKFQEGCNCVCKNFVPK
ncbi:MAG: hypothetical protein M0R48_06780 [Candidatus Omnitrophica bacterium]|nr:hypothetical protein [Candidatus Omnitrophota bacterium]